MRRLTAVLVLLTLLTSSLDAAAPDKDHCVILISVDGLAGFYLDDERADMPTLRRLAREGARVEGLVCSFPTVTWPNHTTLITGVPPGTHGVIGNNYFDRKSQTKVGLILDPLFDKEQVIKTPTVFDVAHRGGLKTAGICWPATRNARTLDLQVPDMFQDGWTKYGTQGWLAELRKAGLPVDKQGIWAKTSGGGVQRDWLYARMAANAIREHHANLVLIHLVEVDHIQHRYGPRSDEAYWSVSYADDRIRDIVEAARKSAFGENVTIVVASDHGFYPIEKDIRPNVVLREAGLVTVEKSNVTKRAAWCVAQGGGCMVYILDDKNRAEIKKTLTKKLGGLEGVAAVIETPEQFERLGLADRRRDPRAPDFWLSAKSGYSFTESTAGDVVAPRSTRGGTHGYLPGGRDMQGTLVLSGRGIKPGTKLPETSNTNVAPTLARLLGLEMPSATGKVLTKALSE
jgi:predicted AlkP superfamily pyrophosphatase or phosphodiesterase